MMRVLAHALLLGLASGSCNTDSDCSLNGKCDVQSTYVCILVRMYQQTSFTVHSHSTVVALRWQCWHTGRSRRSMARAEGPLSA